MVEARSLRTIAAARQNEMNANATVVATTTLVVVARRTSEVVSIDLVRVAGLSPVLLDNDYVMAVAAQTPRQTPVAAPPPAMGSTDHDQGIGCECRANGVG